MCNFASIRIQRNGEFATCQFHIILLKPLHMLRVQIYFQCSEMTDKPLETLKYLLLKRNKCVTCNALQLDVHVTVLLGAIEYVMYNGVHR